MKRVIGLPGDHLKIVDQQVYVNGKPLSEPYVVHDPASGYGDPLNYNFPPVGNQMYLSSLQPEWAHDIRKYIQGDELVVPPGKYFAMGDNRDHSLDSRYWGFVDRDAIMGRPVPDLLVDRCQQRGLRQHHFWPANLGHFRHFDPSSRAHALEPHAAHRALSSCGADITLFLHGSERLPSV